MNQKLWRCLRAVWAVSLLGAGLVHAATPTTPRAACLVKPSAPLKYPEGQEERRIDGTMRFKLIFTHPDRPPKVEPLNWSGTKAMFEASEDYLFGYRMPCLEPGERLEVEQELSFVDSPDEAEALRKAPLRAACRSSEAPNDIYVRGQTGTSIKQLATGHMLVDLTFTAPDAPPQSKTVYFYGPQDFAQWVERQIAGMRSTCVKKGGEPATVRQLFQMTDPNEPDVVLKDMGLVAFLRAVKEPAKVPVKFDLDKMACPFKVRWQLYQPAAENGVDEIGARVPERKPFLDWLGTLALDLDKRQFIRLFGAQTVISVPCGTIEL